MELGKASELDGLSRFQLVKTEIGWLSVSDLVSFQALSILGKVGRTQVQKVQDVAYNGTRVSLTLTSFPNIASKFEKLYILKKKSFSFLIKFCAALLIAN